MKTKKSLFKTFIIALCITTFCALILPTTPTKATLVEVGQTNISNYSLLDFYTEYNQEEVDNNFMENGIEIVTEMTNIEELGSMIFGNFMNFIDLKLLPLIINFNHFFIL